MTDWNPERFALKKDNLVKRSAIIKAIRRFFDDQGFSEVETPILQVCPVMDAHIHGFRTELKGMDLNPLRTLYLHTSPEFEMKMLMVAGLEKLYQICHVFRNGDDTTRHSPEFTMIEWYRTHADYTAIMEDCVGLLRACATAAGTQTLRYKDMVCDPFAEWERLTLQQAFENYADIDLQAFLDDKQAFAAEITKKLGIRVAGDDHWDDLFFRVMDAKIEPRLGMGRPTILCEYPASMASLSRKKPGDPRFAERFELYACGIELANAFSELTDAKEQRQRFHAEMDLKEQIYGERYPLDEDFLAALEHGMAESGGIALGIDRLVMLAVGAEDIDQVLWCGKP